jgi:hypothetical protein
MALERAWTRRVVTGHDEVGRAVFFEDEQLAGAPLGEDAERADAAFFHLWATHQMPVDNSDNAIEAQRAGSASTVAGTGEGSVLRVGVLRLVPTRSVPDRASSHP